MNNKKGYLPIMVEREEKETWYLDISNLNLSELLQLRKELITENNTITVLDSIIQKKNNVYVNNIHYYADKGNGYMREYKKDKKNKKTKLKRKTKEKRGMIINGKH